MCQRREEHIEDGKLASQASDGDGDGYHSDQATCGSPYHGSDDLGITQSPSRSMADDSEADHRISIPDLMSPLSPVGSSGNKRSLEEMLQDDKVLQQDKLSAEIDQLAGETREPGLIQAGPSATSHWGDTLTHHRKRGRSDGEPSTSQVHSAPESDEQKARSKRRSARRHDTPRSVGL
ncbi:hypothetical protein F5Y17DRAFT_442698, partial [Xylariaceae sp. FL0594]